MMIDPLPNDRILKPKKRRYTAIKTLFSRINIKDELCSSISCCYYR
jgi:hypothetical protein